MKSPAVEFDGRAMSAENCLKRVYTNEFAQHGRRIFAG